MKILAIVAFVFLSSGVVWLVDGDDVRDWFGL